MNFRHELRRLLWKFGYDISRYTPAHHALARRGHLLRLYEIDTVLDIGANVGQFAWELRRDLGYSGCILSFEPLTSAYEALRTSSARDSSWRTFNYALGDSEATLRINVAANSQSSSLLGMLPLHLESAPESKYTGQEEIEVKTLDSVFERLCSASQNIYLKIDTQGFESRVLRGAERSLSSIDTVQIEMSLAPLYQDELSIEQMCLLMIDKGYSLVSLENGFADPTSGRLLQADGIFHRFHSLRARACRERASTVQHKTPSAAVHKGYRCLTTQEQQHD